jgi:predicted protein tyrosine phosphatase
MHRNAMHALRSSKSEAGQPSPRVWADLKPPLKPRLHVLFVCSMNKWRSPTAEYLYRNDPRLQARSAGTRAEAKQRMNEGDIKWADVIFVMEREHKQWIVAHFKSLKLPRIEILDIPDDYQYMDPELQRQLQSLIDPEIDAILTANK